MKLSTFRVPWFSKMSYQRNVIFLQWRRVAAEVEGGRALVAADEVAALAARVAHVVVVALALKIEGSSFLTALNIPGSAF